MGIIWLILKIILTLFLVILALVIGIALWLLLTPIAYDAQLHKQEDFTLKSCIRLFFVVKCLITWQEGEASFKVSLFGKSLTKKDKVSDKQTEVEEIQVEEIKVDNTPSKTSEVKQSKIADQYSEIKQDKDAKSRQTKADKKGQNTQNKKNKKVQNKTKKKQAKTTKISQAIDKAKAILADIKTVWDHPYRPITLGAIWTMLKSIGKAIRPKQFDFYLEIGKESPDETGRMIAFISPFFPLYSRYGQVVGNFNKQCLIGDANIKGKFNLWQLLRPVLKCGLNKKVRSYIRMLLHLRKEDSDGNQIKQ